MDSEESAPSLGSYVLLGLLGRGGMGEVYRARHTTLGVERAVKVVTGLTPKRQARFQREAEVLARVQHANVVRIFEAGQENGLAYFAMEFVSGAPLNHICKQGRMPLDQALDITIQIAEGVEALHAQGIVHRDLKPGNVVISEEGQAKVLDFGLAVNAAEDERLTQTGATLGTLAYMAIEQIRNSKAATPRSDVYSLAAILFELLTGEYLATGTAQQIVAKLISRSRPRIPSDVDPKLPGSLDELCLRALSNDPAQRPARAGLLADELRAIRSNPGQHQRRRLPWIAAGAALLLGAVAVGAGWALGAETKARPATDPPPASDEPAPVESKAAWLREGATRRGALGVPAEDPLAFCTAAQTWLREFADHPGAAAVQGELEAATRDLFPYRISTFVHSTPQSAGGVRFHSGASQAASISDEGVVRLWSLSDPRVPVLSQQWRVPGRQSSALHLLTPNTGSTFYVAGLSRPEPGSVREAIYQVTEAPDLSSKRPRLPVGEFMRASCAVLSPTGDAAYIPGVQRKGQDAPPKWFVYRLALPGLEREAVLGPLGGPVTTLELSPDGWTLVAGTGNRTTMRSVQENAVYVWDLARPKSPPQRTHLLSSCTAVAFVEPDAFVAGTGLGNLYRLEARENPTSLRPSQSLFAAERDRQVAATAPRGTLAGPVQDLAFVERGSLLIAGSGESRRKPDVSKNELRFWDLKAGREHTRIAVTEAPFAVLSLDVSADRRWLLVGTRRGSHELWALAPPP